MITLKPEVFAALKKGKLEDVQGALQHAIQLEHATIPPYFYAYISLKSGSENKKIETLLRSVVLEEMLHMALACNVLNAIGGSPVIDSPNFIPSYPGPLPGAVAGGLTVPLKPFSKELVKEVFMKIEEPEKPINFPEMMALSDQPITIGQFYTMIKGQLETLNKEQTNLFAPERAGLQVTWQSWPDLIKVTDLNSAKKAIDKIIEQGEGTTSSPESSLGKNKELAHYYRFKEIVLGKELIKNPEAKESDPPEKKYIYSSKHPIPFKETDVVPLVDNPKADKYAGKAQEPCNQFNGLYTEMLRQLHIAFNGQPGKLKDAVVRMFELTDAAANLTKEVVDTSRKAGPSFEFHRLIKAGPPLSFVKDIKPLFSPGDIDCMKSSFDLSKYEDVRKYAEKIYIQVKLGNMPPGTQWSADRVQKFSDWIDDGMKP